MIDVDDLVRQALLPPPAGFPNSVAATKAQLFDDIRSGRRRRRRLRVRILKSTALPLLLAGVIVAALLPQFVNPPPAAATVLRTASASVSAQPSITLAPGQYLYTEYRSLNEVVAVPRGASATAKAAATATFEQTLQVWTDRNGTGQYAQNRGALQFSSPANEDAWQASPFAQRWEQSHFRAEQIGSSIQDVTTDVARLPTDPTVLAAQIAAGKTGTTVDQIPAGPDTTFERAASLLVSPNVGMTPALRAALYEVLAMQTGVSVTSGVTSKSGAKGTAVSVNNATPGTVDRLVVDPHSGTPLEADAAPISMTTPISTPSGSATACSRSVCSSIQPSTGTVILVTLWTTPGHPEVVNSEGATTAAGS